VRFNAHALCDSHPGHELLVNVYAVFVMIVSWFALRVAVFFGSALDRSPPFGHELDVVHSGNWHFLVV
jgi:hypothetical protein